MKQIIFYFDFVSPFAYLAIEHLPQALQGLDTQVCYRPILLGSLFKTLDFKSPAQVPAKRQWTYRHVLWLGHSMGIELDMPATHPYNPLPHLRMALGTSEDGNIERGVALKIFRHIWQGGGEALDPQSLASLEMSLAFKRQAQGEGVKKQLKTNTDEALAAGVFGTPSFVVDGKMFWGLDSFAMLRSYLKGDPWFDTPAWTHAADRPSALEGSHRVQESRARPQS